MKIVLKPVLIEMFGSYIFSVVYMQYKMINMVGFLIEWGSSDTYLSEK